jgi:catechol 2,3-dioxygenase-like lactoylglutathione lyase family enzyme
MTTDTEFRYVFYSTPGKYEETLAFYEQALGLERAGDFGYGAYFAAGGGFVEILDGSHQGREIRDVALPEGEYVPPQGGWVLIDVPDVDAAHQHLLSVGAEVTRAPEDASWRFRHLYVRDPSGNLISLFTPLGR